MIRYIIVIRVREWEVMHARKKKFCYNIGCLEIGKAPIWTGDFALFMLFFYRIPVEESVVSL